MTKNWKKNYLLMGGNTVWLNGMRAQRLDAGENQVRLSNCSQVKGYEEPEEKKGRGTSDWDFWGELGHGRWGPFSEYVTVPD